MKRPPGAVCRHRHLVRCGDNCAFGQVLSGLRLARDKSGECAAQRQFALLRALPRSLGAPANQDLTQIADGDIDGCRQIDLAVGNIVAAIVTELDYFGGHSAPHSTNHPGQDGRRRLTSRDLADR